MLHSRKNMKKVLIGKNFYNSGNELLSATELIENKFFRVPDYQRGFAWEEKQIRDICTDIEHIRLKNHKHYTGTVVITSTSEDHSTYDIVDGQQRLTTLIIILQLINHKFPGKFPNLEKKFLIRNGKRVLEMNNETKVFFNQVIYRNQSDKADINSKINIQNAKLVINEWIENNRDNIDSIYETVTTKLGFLCFAPENTNEIGIMFEVINNRGKRLSELEKIKNYFIYLSTINNKTELKDKINERWGIILKYLNSAEIFSSEDENRFLRNCYIVFYSYNKSKSWYVYNELKDLYRIDNKKDSDNDLDTISRFIDFIETAAKHYSFLKDPAQFVAHNQKNLAQDFYHVLNQLRCHPVNASISPLYLAVMNILENNGEHDNEVLQILRLIEILNFRVYVLPNAKISRADSHQGTLFSWAHKIYNEPNWNSNTSDTSEITVLGNSINGDIFDFIKENIHDFTLEKCSQNTFVASLTVDEDESIDYYKWNGLRFFLASYEESLKLINKETWEIDKILVGLEESRSGGKNNDYLSREHIWARENKEKDFSHDYREKRRLGNFVLLGLSSNQNVKDKDISEKIEYWKKHFSKSLMQVNELEVLLRGASEFVGIKMKRKTKNYHDVLAKHLIDSRENALIKFALNRWKLPGEKIDKFDEVNSFRANDDKNRNYHLI